jgi:hypothetical protein
MLDTSSASIPHDAALHKKPSDCYVLFFNKTQKTLQALSHNSTSYRRLCFVSDPLKLGRKLKICISPSPPIPSHFIATRYGQEGTGIETRWGEIFRTHPYRHWDPPSLLYNGYRVSFSDEKRSGISQSLIQMSRFGFQYTTPAFQWQKLVQDMGGTPSIKSSFYLIAVINFSEIWYKCRNYDEKGGGTSSGAVQQDKPSRHTVCCNCKYRACVGNEQLVRCLESCTLRTHITAEAYSAVQSQKHTTQLKHTQLYSFQKHTTQLKHTQLYSLKNT